MEEELAGLLVDDAEWMVDTPRREWKDSTAMGRGGGVRRNLMKQMETRVNCANTGGRDGMNGGRRERERSSERAENE